MTIDPHQVQQIFTAALQLPEAERVLYLDKECGQSTALRREVESLLNNAGVQSHATIEDARNTP
ncbi:MAG: hypothetical protein QGH76_02465, partial [Phycisphaerales bacterium]|nr:hypothetical protein [Phycisphaerales bacterium]